MYDILKKACPYVLSTFARAIGVSMFALVSYALFYAALHAANPYVTEEQKYLVFAFAGLSGAIAAWGVIYALYELACVTYAEGFFCS